MGVGVGVDVAVEVGVGVDVAVGDGVAVANPKVGAKPQPTHRSNTAASAPPIATAIDIDFAPCPIILTTAALSHSNPTTRGDDRAQLSNTGHALATTGSPYSSVGSTLTIA